MQYYKNIYCDSDILAYEIGCEYIRVLEKYTLNLYEFSHKTIGYTHVENMKLLANRGYGLQHYIEAQIKDVNKYLANA